MKFTITPLRLQKVLLRLRNLIKKSKPLHLLFIFTFLTCLPSSRLFAQWSTNTAVNNDICTAGYFQGSPNVTSDGAGGAIITWYDFRNSTDYDIYVQRIDVNGYVQWTTDGISLCNATQSQNAPRICTDGAGGAIIAWLDLRNGSTSHVYAQRIDGSGAIQWTTNGVAICTASNNRVGLAITADGAGGAIMTWGDRRNGTGKFPQDVYAQRINAAGVVQWTTNGVAICTQAAAQESPNLTSDGAQGAIIMWNEYRNGTGNPDIYGQHVDSSGTTLWTTNGIAICNSSGQQINPTLISDGSGGAIAAWDDNRNGGTSDIYAQQVDGTGSVGWTANGIAVCTSSGAQFSNTIITDNAGGAFLTWNDRRNSSLGDVYAQHIRSSGTAAWTANGIAICTESTAQVVPTIAPSGTGAIISWTDSRNSDPDIYAQRIDSSGTTLWTTDGIAISTASYSQSSPVTLASTGGSAIMVWDDSRNAAVNNNNDIYAQRVNADGSIGSCSPPSISSTHTDIECGYPESGAIDITVSGATSPYTYAWTGIGVSPTSEDQSGLGAGNYIVIATDSLGCSNTDTITINDCEERFANRSTLTNKKEIITDIKISVQPNPSNNYFNLRVGSRNQNSPVSIRVFNASGKLITQYQNITVGNILKINSGKWAAGIYYAEVIQATGREVIKLVKVD